MRVAIIGAGFTGLAAAYDLTKQGHQVTVFEKNHYAGGLASGIRQVVKDYPHDWEWDIERFYHHWFTNDEAILQLIKEIGAEDRLIIRRPITSTWYKGSTYQLDSPLSLMRFSPISLASRLRTGLTLAYLKYSVKQRRDMPWHVSTDGLEDPTADKWLSKWMGDESYKVLWKPLLKGKFDHYYDQINMTWFWARVFKRTPKLAYFKGGFGELVNLLVEKIKKQGGEIRLNQNITRVKTYHGVSLQTESGPPEPFDHIIVTTPPPTLAKMAPELPDDYKQKLTQQDGIGAFVLLLALDQPLMDEVYWLNITNLDWPFLAVVEHTNFIDPKHYGGKHLVYIGDYLPADHPRMQKTKEELLAEFEPFLQQLCPNYKQITIHKSWLFREKFAQPIVRKNHATKILPLKTPLPNLYLASMSQVYPWDRGTNYAVELGRKVAKAITKPK